MSELLKVDNLSIAFGGLKAVDDVTFTLNKGEITALIGPNGSGKTTVINLITGFYRANSGSIVLNGKDIVSSPANAHAALGVARTFQNIRLFGDLSVRENVLIGMQSRINYGPFLSLFPNGRKNSEEKRSNLKVEELLEEVGLKDLAGEKAGSLPYGSQRKVEIVRALASNPSLLLLDEPAAGMNPQETVELKDFIKSIINRVEGILLVEHDMKLVMTISDHIIVLNHGRKICDGTPDIVKNDPGVVEAYLGKEGAKNVTD